MTKPWDDPTKTSAEILADLRAAVDAAKEPIAPWDIPYQMTEHEKLSLTMGRKQGGYAAAPYRSAKQQGHTAALAVIDEIQNLPEEEEFWSAIGYPVRIDVILPSCFTQPPTDPIAHNLHMAAQQIRLYEHLTGQQIDAETRRDMARAYVAKIGAAQ